MRALRRLLPILLVIACAGAARAIDVKAVEDEADKHLSDGEYKEACALYASIVKEKPEYAPAYAGRGVCEKELRRYAAAKADLEKALALEPGRTDCRAPLAWLAFYYGDYEGAKKLLDASHEEGDEDEEPDDAEKGLVLLLDGPFAKRFGEAAAKLTGRTKSGHYTLTTDLGAKPGEPIAGDHTAEWQKAADLLDRVYAEVYSKEFPFPKDDKIVFNVVIFSRSRDYKRLERVLGTKPGTTDGMYSSELKTLAVLDEADMPGTVLGLHAATVDTIFHEGLHQFVDFYVDDAPPWYDEGLGEFFGPTAVGADGKFRFGATSKTRLESIRDALAGKDGVRPVPLADFLVLEQDDFVAPERVDVNYAEAWAFMHYLRSEPKGRAILAKYLDALQAGKDIRGAFESAFEGANLDELDAAWKKHIAALAK